MTAIDERPRWTGPINSRTGMPIGRRSFGSRFDPDSRQRCIGSSVYIFRRVPGGIDTWRLVITADHAHYWTLEHSLRYAAAIAYSVTTGGYTIEQLEGEACALCGDRFEPGQDLEQVWRGDGYDLYAHVQCAKGGASR